VAAADGQVSAYDAAFIDGAVGPSLDLRSLIDQTVAVLSAQSTVCAELSHAFAVPSALKHDAHLSLQLALLGEDLALFSAQVAAVMQRTGADVAGMPHRLESPRAMAYAERIGEALPLLRRAEAWLEMIDQHTGAHATLPGCAPVSDTSTTPCL
jgi:hypothetical protein